MKQQGPKEIEIPAQAFLSCYGCDFLTHQMIHSGRDPKYADNCTHPEYPMQPRAMSGNLSRDRDGHIKTPIHCPFRKKELRDSAGSPGHGTSGMFMKSQIDYDGQNQ